MCQIIPSVREPIKLWRSCAIENVSMGIPKNSIVSLIGPSGYGKAPFEMLQSDE